MIHDKNKKLHEISEIFKSCKIGFEFEFYSKSNLSFKDVSKSLSKHLKKEINLKLTEYNKNNNIINIKPQISKNDIKTYLTNDLTGGDNMMELITEPVDLYSSKILLYQIFNWMEINAKTDFRCGFHYNISFDSIKIENIDTLKFILNFDEEFIYDRFPSRRENVYCKMIDYIIPNNIFNCTNKLYNVNKNLFKTPANLTDEHKIIKYFGVNFSKLEKNYLEFRYIGGRNYHKKLKEIYDILDYTAIVLYNTLKNPEYTKSDVDKLNIKLKSFKDASFIYDDMVLFMNTYKNVHIYIDLKQKYQELKTFYNYIKDKIYNILHINNIDNIYINYDTDIHRFQIKNGASKKIFIIEDTDIIDCKFEYGIYKNCNINQSNIKYGHFINCNFISDNEIYKSKIINSSIINYDNKFIKSYVSNNNNYIRGEYVDCIVKGNKFVDYEITFCNKSKMIKSSKDDLKDNKINTNNKIQYKK